MTVKIKSFLKNNFVSVVIPNLNGEKSLEKNLPKLIEAQKFLGNNIFEIVIVDDASTDGSVGLIKNKFPEVKLIRHKINRGFPSSVNTGVRSAKGDFILLINADVFPNHDFLVKPLLHFKNSRVFAVSLHEKGIGPTRGNFSDGYISLMHVDEKAEQTSSFYVTRGSGGVFRRKTWVELGGMDEKLMSPFYWEDVDICYRAAKRGYICLWEPEAIVVHKHESTINKLPKTYVAKIMERNELLMLWKNITSPALIKRHMLGVLSRVVKDPGYIKIVVMALGKIGTAMEKRKKETKESRISDEAVFARFANGK